MAKTLLKLHIPEKLANEPVVQHLMRDFDLVAVMKAGRFTDKGATITVGLEGKSKEIERALEYLSEVGVKVEAIE